MTQITVRQVDDALAQSIREAARNAGESMNALLLQILRRQFLGPEQPDDVPPPPRNDLRKFRKGWVEDPECEAALAEFGRIDHHEWE